MASGMPTALVQMQYWRQDELEADGFTLAAMRKACLPPKAFAEILYRLQNQPFDDEDEETEGKEQDKEEESKTVTQHPIADMFSTHPNTLDRIKPFMEAKPAC
jgi:Zn-dependent protease with chaperone function